MYKARKTASLLLAAMLFIMLLSACSSEKNPDKLEGTLTVVAASDKDFLAAYGNAISIHYPKVKINVMTLPDTVKTMDQYMNWITTTSGDLYMINDPIIYKNMLDAGALFSLDALIKKDKLDIENDPLGATSYLRGIGDGDLFALPTGFRTKALFINKSLFESEGIPLANKPMNWSEVMELSLRFAPPHIGFDSYAESPGQFLISIAENNQLQLWDGKQMTIHTKQWQEEASRFQSWYKSNRLDLTAADKFVEGKAAITIQPPSYGERLLSKDVAYKWQMLASPVLEDDRLTTPDLNLSGLVGIGANTKYQELAWEILQYIMNNSAAAATLDHLPIYDKPAAINGINVESLYEGKFGGSLNVKELSQWDPIIRELAIKQFDFFLQGSQSIEVTLNHIEDEGENVIKSKEK